MENVIIRNIEEKDIPSVVDIQISGWQIAYKGIIDDGNGYSMILKPTTKQWKT